MRIVVRPAVVFLGTALICTDMASGFCAGGAVTLAAGPCLGGALLGYDRLSGCGRGEGLVT